MFHNSPGHIPSTQQSCMISAPYRTPPRKVLAQTASSPGRALFCSLSFVGTIVAGGSSGLRWPSSGQAVPSASLVILQSLWTAASLRWPQPQGGSPSPSLSGLPKKRRGRPKSRTQGRTGQFVIWPLGWLCFPPPLAPKHPSPTLLTILILTQAQGQMGAGRGGEM